MLSVSPEKADSGAKIKIPPRTNQSSRRCFLFSFRIDVGINYILEGKGDTLSLHGRKVNTFDHLQGLSALESIDRYRQILADGAIEIAELDVVAASPVIRTYVCGFVGVPDLSVGAIQIIVAHILNQAAAAFFSDELDVDGRVVTVDIAGVEL